MTLIDTNVVADVLTADPVWLEWSTEQLSQCRGKGLLLVNEVTYAELAVRFEAESDLERALTNLSIQLQRAPTAALFSAGRAFARYRAAGGARMSLLPDFFIGAHAQTAGMPILSRDVRRYRSYFPDVALITPQD
jgi:predicted nucleic acid-binding protein